MGWLVWSKLICQCLMWNSASYHFILLQLYSLSPFLFHLQDINGFNTIIKPPIQDKNYFHIFFSFCVLFYCWPARTTFVWSLSLTLNPFISRVQSWFSFPFICYFPFQSFKLFPHFLWEFELFLHLLFADCCGNLSTYSYSFWIS